MRIYLAGWFPLTRVEVDNPADLSGGPIKAEQDERDFD